MELKTTSSVISFARELEENGIHFYEGLAKNFPQKREIFLSFASENKKTIMQVERAYYGVISDALEGAFSFSLDKDSFVFSATLQDNETMGNALNKALKIEKSTASFYIKAAEQSKGLLADLPQAFMLVARKRSERIAKLLEIDKSIGKD